MTHPNQGQQQVGTPWTDFNSAAVQQDYDVIPKGTLAKVRLTIKPGGYDEPHMGWTEGWATRSETGAAYLNGEFVVLEGPFAKRKVWSLIGLHSPKGPAWEEMGRSFVRAILASARGIRQDDISPPAVMARRLNHIGELNGIEFIARIGIERDSDGEDKNAIKSAITPEHKQYQALMNAVVQPQQGQAPQAQAALPPGHQPTAQQSSYNFQQPAQQQPQNQPQPDQYWNGD